MKLIQQLVRLWFGSRTKTKTQEKHIPEEPDHPSAGKGVRKSRRTPLADDDSPPGYKIRWYH